MNKSYFLVLAILLLFGGCTKDDLCSETTQTTSLLIIEFRDITDRISAKAVQDLRVQVNNAEGTEVITSVNDTIVSVPLNTEADLTSLLFTINAANEANANSDGVDFNYERQEVYVNRACSFKVVYTDLLLSVIDDPENWILDTEIINPIVENEKQAHITIFH